MLGELIEEGSPITLNAGDQPLAESSDPKVSGLTRCFYIVSRGRRHGVCCSECAVELSGDVALE